MKKQRTIPPKSVIALVALLGIVALILSDVFQGHYAFVQGKVQDKYEIAKLHKPDLCIFLKDSRERIDCEQLAISGKYSKTSIEKCLDLEYPNRDYCVFAVATARNGIQKNCDLIRDGYYRRSCHIEFVGNHTWTALLTALPEALISLWLVILIFYALLSLLSQYVKSWRRWFPLLALFSSSILWLTFFLTPAINPFNLLEYHRYIIAYSGCATFSCSSSWAWPNLWGGFVLVLLVPVVYLFILWPVVWLMHSKFGNISSLFNQFYEKLRG